MGSEHQRVQLAALERDLRRDDPALARRFASFAAATSGPPGWGALAASGALLVVTGVLLAASAHWGSPVLLVAAIVVFCLAGLPVGCRRTRPRRPGGATGRRAGGAGGAGGADGGVTS